MMFRRFHAVRAENALTGAQSSLSFQATLREPGTAGIGAVVACGQTQRVSERSSGIPSRSLVERAAKEANDPHDIADSYHADDQPQEGACGRIECQVNPRPSLYIR